MSSRPNRLSQVDIACLNMLEGENAAATRSQSIFRWIRNGGISVFIGDLVAKSALHLYEPDSSLVPTVPHDIPSVMFWVSAAGITAGLAGALGRRRSHETILRTKEIASGISLAQNVVPPAWALGIDSFLVREIPRQPSQAVGASPRQPG